MGLVGGINGLCILKGFAIMGGANIVNKLRRAFSGSRCELAGIVMVWKLVYCLLYSLLNQLLP